MSALSLEELEQHIDQAMIIDRYRLRQKLRTIKERQRRQQPIDELLGQFQTQLNASLDHTRYRQDRLPKIELDETLPITARADDIIQAIKEHQVIIICGETGSGKSTQLPLLCMKAGRGIAGQIAHTQPRRIAARSIAARIAEELKTPLGKDVGYKIRFQDITSRDSYVKLMTDGVLLAESQTERFLNQYDTIIVDEAHERSLNIDFILGYVKNLLPKRPDLRLIITSATIDAERFSQHYVINGKPAPILEVSGRMFPVELRYRPLEKEQIGDEGEVEVVNWKEGLMYAVDELLIDHPGDILAFLPTERDILDASKILRGRYGSQQNPPIEIVPLYGRLSQEEQNRIFANHRGTRIVLATNVAESSITVPGIRSVIDLGLARISRYSARSKIQRLPIEAVSKASANQRKGRCGRVGPGVCIRLYSEEDFNGREDFTPAEILRTNLAGVILQTKSLQLGPLEQFPFLDEPKPTSIRDGYHTLFEIGAIDAENELTEIGKKLCKLPVDPRIGRMLIAAENEGCLHEVLVIASALENQDPRERPLDKQQQADQAHSIFKHESSDFLSYLKIWNFYHESKQSMTRNKLQSAMREKFLNMNRLREWADIYQQLLSIMEEHRFKNSSRPDDERGIHQSLLTGLMSNVSYLTPEQEYSGMGGQKLVIWPGSALAKQKPKWIMAAELIETSKRFARTITRIQPEWIEPLASHLVKKTYTDPEWDREMGSAVAFERILLYGMPIVARRRVRYAKIDPAKSRDLFIREGLVYGELDVQPAFLRHNQNLIREIEMLQAKSRRQDLLVNEEARYNFYDDKLPPEACDLVTFDQWRIIAELKHPQLLHMTRDDLLTEKAKELDTSQFPNALSMNNMRLPLEYHLDPGAEEDGVTLSVPQEAVAQLNPNLLAWLVPGLLEEKITAMIRGLPKIIRTMFVPAPQTAKEIMGKLTYGQGAFLPAVSAEFTRIAGQSVSPEMLEAMELPRHLQMNVRVIDQGGTILAVGRDIKSLQKQFSSSVQSMGAIASHTNATGSQGKNSGSQTAIGGDVSSKWQKDGLTKWDFEPLPISVPLERGGIQVQAYPAIVDQKTAVGLHLFPTQDISHAIHQKGVTRLFLLTMQPRIAAQIKYFPRLQELELYGKAHAGFQNFRQQLIEFLAGRAFDNMTDWPRNEQQFQMFQSQGIDRITVAIQESGLLLGKIYDHLQLAKKASRQLSTSSTNDARKDIDQQLEMLTGAGFLAETPKEWLLQYPRYFQGIEFRCRKLLTSGAEADRKRRGEFDQFWKPFLIELKKRPADEPADPEWTLFRFMLEEYRVSLFAQELGTCVTISAKRLERQWKKALKQA
jgi:ATP-dependent helicase HrpA